MSDFSISMPSMSDFKSFTSNLKNDVQVNIEKIKADVSSSINVKLEEFKTDVKTKTEEFKEPKIMDDLKKTGATVLDVLGNFGIGVVDTVEQLTDGAAMAVVGDIVIPIYELMDKLDLEDGVDYGKEADNLKEDLKEFVAADWTEGMSENLANVDFIKEYSTCSDMTRELSKGAGSMVSYIGLSMVPYVGPVLTGLGAAGSAAEMAYKNGATYGQAITVANVAGIAGAVANGMLNKVGSAAKGAQSMKAVLGYTTAGAAVAEVEPVANALVQYFTYGKNNYDSFKDFWKDNGFTMQAIFAAGAGAIRTFATALKGLKNYKANAQTTAGTTAAVETIDDATKSIKKLSDDELSTLQKEYNELLEQTNQEWYKHSKEATVNHWAQDLNLAQEVDQIDDRLREVSDILVGHKIAVESEKLPQYVLDSPEYKELVTLCKNQGISLKELGGLKVENTNVTKEMLEEADNLAKIKFASASKAEPEITDMMHSLESDTRSLIGLDHRLKGQDSLARKIITDFTDETNNITSLQQATDAVNDSVRYTMICEPSTIKTDMTECIDELISKGYKVEKFKNTFDNDIYKGVNAVLTSPDGTHFELQFHTENSFTTKEAYNHLFYEISRNDFVSQQQKSLANGIMEQTCSKIEVPDGLAEFKITEALKEKYPNIKEIMPEVYLKEHK